MPKSTPYSAFPVFDASLFNEMLAKLICEAQKNDVIHIDLTLRFPPQRYPVTTDVGDSKPFSLASFLRAQAKKRGGNSDK